MCHNKISSIQGVNWTLELTVIKTNKYNFVDIFKRILGSRFITIKRGIWIWINCMIIIYSTVCLILAPFLSCSTLFIYLLRIGGDVYCIEGWSDFHFFCDFRKWAHCYRWLYLYTVSSIPKNRQILQRARAAHARQNFHSFKITVTLKIIFFLSGMNLLFTSKTNCQK